MTLFYWLASVLISTAASDVMIGDFEQPDYRNWRTVGEAFGSSGARDALTHGKLKGFEGAGVARSAIGGRAATGVLL